MGFPSFVVLDSDGELVAVASNRSVDGFRATVEAGEQFAAMAKATDADSKKKVLMQRIDWQAMPFAQAKAAVAALELGADEKASVANKLFNLELMDTRLNPDKQAGLRHLVSMLDENRVPTDAQAASTFWRYLASGAQQLGDATAFGHYVAYLEKEVETNPRAQAMLERAKKTLEGMTKK